MPAGDTRTVRIINKIEGEAAVRKLAKDYGRLNKSIKNTSNTMQLFKRAFQVAIASFGVRELVRAADSFQLLRDRIKVFTGSTESAAQVFEDLGRAAKFTKTSVDSLATSYNRIALATKELGLSSDQILATTVALQQTFRISGSTIAEAAAATVQLSQGLSSGQLRGQELRSVLEQNALFAGLLADELGTTRGNLIKFAESGKITSQVVLETLSKNFDSINKQAAQLGTTIGQSLTIAMDALRFKIDALNREFGISSKFEQGISLALDNLELLGGALAVIISSNVIANFAGQVIQAGGALKFLAQGFTPLNIATASLLAFGFAVKKIKDGLKGDLGIGNVDKEIKRLNSGIRAQQKLLSDAVKSDESPLEKLFGSRASKIKQAKTELARLNKDLEKFQDLQSRGIKNVEKKGSVGDFVARIRKAILSLNIKAPGVNQGPFAQLNQQLEKGTISLKEYDQALAQIKLDELNKKFKEGKIDVDAYDKGIIALSQNLTGLNPILLGAEQGLRSVANTAGNVAQQISQGFVNAFKNLEDAIFNFTKTGEFNFAKFTQAVIDDITRIVIRTQIIAPAARAIGLALSGGLSGGGAAASGGGGGVGQQASAGIFANGAAFNNGRVTPFAGGGVVSSPTLFPMANGAGLMGEAGPEAIMPLVRRNGKLGVEGGGSGVQVNVINQVGGEVEQQERTGPSGERILDIMIREKTKEAIGSGSLDKAFAENFGMKRVGR